LFDSLIISRAVVDEPKVQMLEDLTIISDEKGEVVGFNIFKVSRDLTLHESFQSFNPEVLAYIKKRLEPHYPFSQETQFVIGYVESSEVIPDTHLHKTKVNVGTEILDIVCGAENIARDEYVVVSLPGSWMPNGMQIKPGKLRGLPSNGMITSAKELKLKHHNFNNKGIIELPEVYHKAVGQDFFTIYQNHQ